MMLDIFRKRDETQMPFNILVVCTGNICRSAMAEIVLREKLAKRGISEREVCVRSAGVSDEEHGHPIDSRARQVLNAAGYYGNRVGAAHRATAAELLESDLIVAMTAAHEIRLRRMMQQAGANADTERIRMWRESDMPDPWYGGMKDFKETLAAIEIHADAIIDSIPAAFSKTATH